MAIPGANAKLGQGMPGGAAGLPGGLPLPGGGATGLAGGLIPVPQIPKPAMGAASPSLAPLPTVINTGSQRGAAEVGTGLSSIRDRQNLIPNSASTRSITDALGILAKVEKGQLKPDRAAKLMQGLTPGDQGKLADLIQGHFSRSGQINRDVVKALQSLQQLPAPDDAQPHDIVTNFTRDASQLITGLPAGIGLAAAYAGKDTYNTLRGKPTSNFMDKIVKPVGHQIADTYSPLVHGDLPGFYGKFHAHPLGPILDAASVFSAGAGTVGRLGRAGEAITAARVGALADAAKVGEGVAGKIPMKVDMAHQAAVTKLWDHLESNPNFDVDHFESLLNRLGEHAHPDYNFDYRGSRQVQDPHSFVQQLGGIAEYARSLAQGPAELKATNNLINEAYKSIDTKVPVDVMKAAAGPGRSLTGDLLGGIQKLKGFDEGQIQSGHPSYDPLDEVGRQDPHQLLKPYEVEQAVPRDEVAPIGTQAAPKMGVIERMRNYLDSGPKNNADLAKITNVQPSLRDFKGPPEDHPLDPVTGLSKVQLAKAGITGFVKGGPKGNLLELYEGKRGVTHEAEIQNYMQDIADVFKNSENLRTGRRSMGQIVKDVASDIRATRAEGKARPTEMASNLPGFISARTTGRALSAAETSLREASDMVRAGAIILRPAYIPNNWAGNSFMSAVHQGAWAPLNLAKSLVISKHLSTTNLAALRKAMGTNPAEAVTNPAGRGYVSSLTQPLYHVMGLAADQPFRDAAFLHEARRSGYSTLKQVDDLFTKARASEKAGAVGNTTTGDTALREIANISRKAQEEIVKFGHMNDAERSVIRNLVFVYSWMRGAGRYAARFPAAHPMQTDLFNKLSGPGNQYIQSVMGGTPSFLAGTVPIGRDKNGNPILINPFSLNPLGTGLQLAQAAAGSVHVIQDPKSFNKYAQNDVTSLLNPIFGSYINARSGGQPMKKQLENTMAFLALRRGLEHPGSGSIYPTTRTEAVGHFALGSLFPRAGDEAAIQKALARENVGHPAALIPQQIRDFKKATGQDIPPQLVSAYQGDLEAIQMQKDFQQHYADSHGASGFRNMPPQNKVEAALAYLTQHSHLPPNEIAQLKQGATQLTTDQEFNSYSNALWAMTGAGQYKQAWDQLMRSSKGSILTRKR